MLNLEGTLLTSYKGFVIDMTKAIIVKNVSKRYKLYKDSTERLLDIISPKKYGKSFYALSEIDFVANQGEVIGFVGINGSGKSTLSNIIAGIVPETTGTVTVNGQVAIIAVAAGLKGDLSGRDNIELKLLMLGFNKKEIKELEQAIIDFSELGDFIDQPVKSYSSGMKSRLGFAISVNVDPDILIIDEALSVGDKAFAEKSLAKMKEFKARGKTMIFVSHSVGQMKKFCDKILWLEYGQVKEYGDVKEVMPNYELFIKQWKELSEKERAQYRRNALADNHLDNKEMLSNLNVNSSKEPKYVERATSRLAKLKIDEPVVLESPRTGEVKENYILEFDKTYYVKRVARKNHHTYYLLSEKPSAVKGIVGWIDAKNLHSYPLMYIDEDTKKYYLKGTGSAYAVPWGGTKDIMVEELEEFTDYEFIVERTDIVNRTFWYYGLLAGIKVWISRRDVYSNKK